MGNIITISGPRGVGKTTVMHQLHAEHDIAPIVPYTTREKRAGEKDGIDYRFVDNAQFTQIRHARPMFDVLNLKGNQYGTPLRDFEDVLFNPQDTETIRSVNLAANSAIQLRRQLGSETIKSVFIIPASWHDIEQQMRDKGISEEEIISRRASEPTDLTLLPEFDRIVVNNYNEMGSTVKNIADYALSAFSITR